MVYCWRMNEEEETMNEEEVNIEEAEPSVGMKRARSERSSVQPPQESKKRKPIARRAPVWAHFTLKESDMSKAVCNYCGIEIGCDSKTVGTSPMINHNNRCNMFKTYKESGTQQVMTNDGSGAIVLNLRFDKDLFRRSVNEMIVINELPFSFVESEGFRRFCKNIIPMYTVHCRKTATEDIYRMFMEEKMKLKNLFGLEKKRVSLTTDIWVAPMTSLSYMVITAHWINTNWELQKRIISFKPVTDHKGETIRSHLVSCLEEWGIEKVFTVTCDNAKANDKALRLFTETLRSKGGNALVRNGSLLHMRCCAHILNLIVRDGLEHVSDSVKAIRNAVKYVRSSYDRLKSFALRTETGKFSRGSLPLDCKTRWNSTYFMLTSATKLRGAFQKMFDEDKLYNEYFLQKEEDEEKDNEENENGENDDGENDDGQKRVGPPISSDWEEVSRLATFLKLFFNSTLAFSATQQVTSSLCYHEIVIIERRLISMSLSTDEKLRDQALSMRRKFEKYWDGLLNMNPLVIIASIFDPRNRLEYATLAFEKLYGRSSLEYEQLKHGILKVLREIYDEYVSVLRPSNSHCDSTGSKGSSVQAAGLVFDLTDDEVRERMDLYSEMDSGSTNVMGTELDMYLLEPRVPRDGLGLDYDVLGWWRTNSVRFPILSMVAKDVLAVQVSSVASESAFSTSGRVLDSYRSCLSPFMVESLICLQQWLRHLVKAEMQHQNLEQMTSELAFQDSFEPWNQVEDGV